MPKRASAALLALCLAVVLPLLMSVPPPISASSSSTVSVSNLTRSSTKICRTYQQTGFGADLGQITYCFPTDGAVYFYDDWSPQTNFTLSPIAIAANPSATGSVPLGLSVTLWQNSTTVAFSSGETWYPASGYELW